MTIIDDGVNAAKKYLFGVALKKGVVSAAKLIVAWAISHGIKFSGTVYGITIDLQDQAAMIVAINSGLTIVRNWLKVRFPEKFGWL